MHRSLKLGLYGLVLAGIAGGTLAMTSNGDKAVALDVDGQTKTVHTSAKTVDDVIRDAGYTISTHDMVAPSASTHVKDGTKIVLRKARLLHLTVDGKSRNVWVTAPTVNDVLGQLGYSQTSFASVSRDSRLPLTPSNLEIRTPKRVVIQHDGKKQRVITTAASVNQLLSDVHVRPEHDDRLSVAPASKLTTGETIVLTRVEHKNIVKHAPVPFQTATSQDANLSAGQTVVIRQGQSGVRATTYSAVFLDGRFSTWTLAGQRVTKQPVTKVVHIGTRVSTPDEARALGAQMAAQRGWGSDQFACLNSLWTKESGWRVDATNPDGGAYGIPQALPGDKLASAGPDWQNNAATQITWGLNYIAATYGSPCSAWAHSQAYNWY